MIIYEFITLNIVEEKPKDESKTQSGRGENNCKKQQEVDKAIHKALYEMEILEQSVHSFMM